MVSKADREFGAACKVDAQQEMPGAHRDDARDDDQQRDQEEPVAAPDDVQAADPGRSLFDFGLGLLGPGLFLFGLFLGLLFLELLGFLGLLRAHVRPFVSWVEHDRLLEARGGGSWSRTARSPGGYG